MTPEKIKEVLELHAAWLNDSTKGQRADLRGADLRDAILRGAILNGAILSYAILRGADLRGAILRGAILNGADLRGAILRGADLRGAILNGADLRDAILRGADLRDAILRGVILSGANNIPSLIAAQLTIVPESGQFIGWKKCKDQVLVKVLIGKNAKRSNATDRKCRAEYVKVIEVIGAEVGVSMHDERTEYRVGTIVRCDKWNEDRWVECAGGIHFFLTREEAANY